MNNEENLEKRLREVYSETTVDHILHPRNTEPVANPDGIAEMQSGHSEVLRVWLRVRDEIVSESAFWTNGCAATIACGSMSTELVKGKKISEALAITAEDIAGALENLPEGNFHCAEMAASTLRLALRDCLVTQQQPWKKLYRK